MAQTKAKMKKGIIGVAYAMATLSTDEQTGVQSVTYDTVKNLVTTTSGGREYSAEPRGDSQDVYADSVKVYGEALNDGYDVDLTVLSTLDRQIQKDWLQMQEKAGGVAEYADTPENPYFALIIYEETSDGIGQTTIFPWTQASGRPSDAGKTAEGGAFDWAFPTIPLAATARPTDKLVRFIIDGKEKLTEIPDIDDANGSVTLDRHVLNLAEDDTATLTAVTVPAGETVTWDSASSAVATVDGGVVTAEGEGNTIITASITVDGVTYTDTCTVVVTV